MPSTEKTEKRRDPRVAVRLEVRLRYQSVESFLSEYSMNISKGGLFIPTRDPLREGTRVVLEFQLPGHNVPLKIPGLVAWSTQYDRKSVLIPGMGIRFEELTPADRKKIEHFVEKLRQDRGK